MADEIRGVPIGDLPDLGSVPDDSLLVTEFLGKAYSIPGGVLRQLIQDIYAALAGSIDDVTEEHLKKAIETVLANEKYHGVSPMVDVAKKEDGTFVLQVVDAFGVKEYPIEVEMADLSAVQYVKQELTPEQQAQARENIGAAAEDGAEIVIVKLSGGSDYYAGVDVTLNGSPISADALEELVQSDHIVIGVADGDVSFYFLGDADYNGLYTVPSGTVFNYRNRTFWVTHIVDKPGDLSNMTFTVSSPVSVWFAEAQPEQYVLYLTGEQSGRMVEFFGRQLEPSEAFNILLEAANFDKPLLCYQKDAVFNVEGGGTYTPHHGTPFYYDHETGVLRCERDGYACTLYVDLADYVATAKKTTPYQVAESKADGIMLDPVENKMSLLSAGNPIGESITLPSGGGAALIVTVTVNTETNDYVVDKTFAEIQNAWQAGRDVYALRGQRVFVLSQFRKDVAAVFTSTVANGTYTDSGTIHVMLDGSVQVYTTKTYAPAVLYAAQELTDEQKTQARSNIGAEKAGAAVALPAVKYEAQTLNDEQKAQARYNIGAEAAGTAAALPVVKYEAQVLTDEQKAQARKNIGAIAEGVDSGEVKRILSPERESPVSMESLATGVHVLDGYFTPYEGSEDTLYFYRELVSTARYTDGSHDHIVISPSDYSGLKLFSISKKSNGFELTNYRVNLGDVKEVIESAVRFNAQTLTEEQKAQARQNIGVVDAPDVSTYPLVKYEAQELSDAEKAQARTNINAETAGAAAALKAVSYATQELTGDQKTQARENIGAVGYEPQYLTEEQRERARLNIGAAAEGVVSGEVKLIQSLDQSSPMDLGSLEVGVHVLSGYFVPYVDYGETLFFNKEIVATTCYADGGHEHFSVSGMQLRTVRVVKTNDSFEVTTSSAYFPKLATALLPEQQTLTSEQKAQARQNIEAEKAGTAAALKAVSYEAQSLTEDQKTQTRKNIGAEKSGTAAALPAVKYEAQALTDEQKAQARKNIGVVDAPDVSTLPLVKYEAQELTEDQKTQARQNIGAVAATDVTAEIEEKLPKTATVLHDNFAEVYVKISNFGQFGVPFYSPIGAFSLLLNAANSDLVLLNVYAETDRFSAQAIRLLATESNIIGDVYYSHGNSEVYVRLNPNTNSSALQGVFRVDVLSNPLKDFNPTVSVVAASDLAGDEMEVEIGDVAFASDISDVVRYGTQTLTDEQKQQARQNIGVESDLAIVTTSGSGDAYTAEVPNIKELTPGVSFIMIPHTASTATTPRLTVNGLSSMPLRRPRASSLGMTGGYWTEERDKWLYAGAPYHVMYTKDNYWAVLDAAKYDATDLIGEVPIIGGGTGANTAAGALANLGAVGYTAQTLTEEQQAQARANIGAISTSERGLEVVTTGGTGASYTATVPSIEALTAGVSFIMIPHTASTSTNVKLNVNGFGELNLARPRASAPHEGEGGSYAAWLEPYIPYRVMLMQNSMMGVGGFWAVMDMPKTNGADLLGAVQIANGGTGSTTAAGALTKLGAVGYTAQTLTEEQKAQARSNIGAETAGAAAVVEAKLPVTKYASTSTQNVSYFKISDFGAWGTGAWYQKGFSMLITSRAGETVWFSLSANDSNTTARAFRLMNTYSKIAGVYYSVSESAVYVKAAAWCNNVTAHILSNIGGDYVPTVATVSGLASDAVEVDIVEFGPTSSGLAVGDTSLALLLGGSADRPTYNGNNMALQSDIPALSTENWTFTLEDGSTVTKAVYVG